MSYPPVDTPVETILTGAGPCSRVYWDVVDFPFPNGVVPDLIYQNMKKILESKGFFGELSIMAYVDKESFADELIDAYENAGIAIIHHPHQGEYDRCRVMFLDIAWWAYGNFEYPFKPINLMLISKLNSEQSCFLKFLEAWAYSYLDVLLAMPQLPEVLSSKIHTVSFDCLSTGLLDGGNPIDQSGTVQGHHSNLPMSASPEPRTCVFWDVVDFPFPRGVPPSLVRRKMDLILEKMGFLGQVSIMAYDHEYLPHRWGKFRDDYEKAGITIIHNCQLEDKYARVHTMLVDIVLWALENPANYFEPSNLMVISRNIKKDTDFLNALEALEDRYYNVLLAVPQDLSSSELQTVSFKWLLTSLLDESETLQGLNHQLKHKLKDREENVGFSDGLGSLYDPQPFGKSEITLFLDVQHCPTNDAEIAESLCRKGHRDEVLIRPYADEYYMDLQWKCGTDPDCDFMSVDPLIRVVTESNKYAKITRMLLDLLFWAMNNDDRPQNFMFISKPDTKCNSVIEALEHRGFNLILGPSEEVSLQICKNLRDAERRINQTVKLRGRKLRESRKRGSPPIAVFWLLGEDCPSNPTLLRWNIESTLEKKGFVGFLTITVYLDEGKLSNEVQHAYYNSGMSVHPVPEESVRTKINIMAWDMIKWTFSISEPSHFLVIAKPFQDVMMDCLLEDFARRGLHVLFELPDYMVSFGSFVWSAKSLLDGSCSAPT